MAYNFSFLSWSDFEALSRDLLQEALGVRLESFKSGRDDGIDLRYAPSENEPTTIVQAKHMVGSGYPKLLSTMKKEAQKVETLAPDRYILITSVALTPRNKRELASVLSPYVRSEDDIFGQDDLNNLLGLHSNVEKRHFKLWLTSTNVLQTVLNHGVFVRSEALRGSLEQKMRVYVQNVSFPRALDTLDKEHVVIIAGAPGIGKSMLAEMLIVRFMASDYDPVWVSGDIEEGFDVWADSKRQVFYYDDFLGQTDRMEKLGKNEDSRLGQFIDLVRKSSEKRLILTTREYILQQARLSYERLEVAAEMIPTLIVNLSDYTQLQRARILYNHIYFSDLSSEAIESILEERRYVDITRHRNYNPRIIETVTKLYERAEQPSTFSHFMIEALNDPSRIWSHAFDNQLSRGSQCALLTLASLPRQVTLSDLNEAFVRHHEAREGAVPAPDELRKALRVLEGNFITVSRATSRSHEAETVVQLRNPSILDFLLISIDRNIAEFERLLHGALFYDQTLGLVSRAVEDAGDGAGGAFKPRFPTIHAWSLKHAPSLVAALRRTLDSDSPRIRAVREPTGWAHHASDRLVRIRAPIEQRVGSAIQVLTLLRAFGLDAAEMDAFLRHALSETVTRWETGRGDRDASADLLAMLSSDQDWRSWIEEHEPVIREWFLPEEIEAREFLSLAQVRDMLPFMRDAVSERPSLFKAAETAVEELIQSAVWNSTTLDELEERIGEASELAEAWDVDLEFELFEAGYEQRRDELAAEDYEPDEDDYPRGASSYGSDVGEVDSMFDTLSERSDR